MWSGSLNGEICKWTCQDRVFFLEKIFLYSRINSLFYYEDLKAVISGSEDGSLAIISSQKMEIIRIIKIPYPIEKVLPLRFPMYLFYIQCKNSSQFCYTINGTKLEESEIEGIVGESQIFK